jgi:DNA mismatch repair protein MutS
LAKLPAVRTTLSHFPAERLQLLHAQCDELADLRVRILSSLEDDPPLTLADGGVIRIGVDATLDELRDLSRNSKQYIAQIEQRERQRTGIGSLKVKFNNVFGYYLEISKANLHLAPADYERKQTLVGAERFTTPELKEYEAKVLDAQEKMVEIERRLFAELRSAIAAEARRIRQTALALAEIDLLAAFASLAANRNYCRPKLDDSAGYRDRRGPSSRHRAAGDRGRLRSLRAQRSLSEQRHSCHPAHHRAQHGWQVHLPAAGGADRADGADGIVCPARSARLGLVDRIFTRIGAADNLARGRSTFMVEMTETAAILNTATPRSLILLDEVGRGTATYDGLAIAWAAIEYIHTNTRAKTLFATHYHELTELADRLSGVKNYHVSVKESGGGIVFLRKVEEGAADKSYGIEVAKLAGLPIDVINRAREVLAEHESAERSAVKHLAHDEALGPAPCSSPSSLRCHRRSWIA